MASWGNDGERLCSALQLIAVTPMLLGTGHTVPCATKATRSPTHSCNLQLPAPSLRARGWCRPEDGAGRKVIKDVAPFLPAEFGIVLPPPPLYEML